MINEVRQLIYLKYITQYNAHRYFWNALWTPNLQPPPRPPTPIAGSVGGSYAADSIAKLGSSTTITCFFGSSHLQQLQHYCSLE